MGFVAAFIMDGQGKPVKAVRLLALLPWTVPSIVSANSWRWMLQSDFGLINGMFKSVGLESWCRLWPVSYTHLHLNRSVHSRLYAVHGPDVVPPHPLKRRPLQHKSRADHVLDALVVQIRQYLVDLAGLVVNPLRHLHVQQLLHRGNKGHPLAEGDKPGAVSVLSRLFESQEKIEARHLDLYKRRFLHVLFQKTPVSAAAHKHIHRVLLFQPPQDVYKRQQYHQLDKQLVFRFLVVLARQGHSAAGGEAVSYTHLDVYKRQARTGRFPGRPGPPPG